MRLKAIELEAFRGFHGHQRLDFSGAQIILLQGPNGHGKTSVFDAIEWVLSGEIDRYSEATDERKRSKFVGNLFASNPPVVTLELIGDEGCPIRITRKGDGNLTAQSDYGKSRLEVEINGGPIVVGDAAKKLLDHLMVREAWRGKVEIDKALSVTHMLGQERMNFILRGMKGKERYDAISLLFGTDEFERYESMFDAALKKLKAIRKEQESNLSKERGRLSVHIEKYATLKDEQGVLEGENQDELERIMAEYIERFPDVFHSPELDKIVLRTLIDQQNEKLQQARKRFETDQERPFRLLQETKESWREAKNVLATGPKQVVRFEALEVLRQKHQTLKWLTDTNETYLKNVQIQDVRQQSIDLKSQAAEKLFSEYEGMQRLTQNLRLTIRPASPDLQNLRTVVDTDNARDAVLGFEGLELQAHLRLLDAIGTLEKSVGLYQESKTGLIKADKEYLEWEETSQQLQTFDQQYRSLLSVVQELARRDELLESCPACGTKGITADHLLAHTVAEQEKLDPRLPTVEKAMNDALEKLDKAKQRLNEQVQQYHEDVAYLLQMIESVEHAAEEKRKESIRIQTHVSRLRMEMVDEDTFCQLYKERLNQVGINDIEDIERSLKQKVMLFAIDWQSKTSDLDDEQRSDPSGYLDWLKKRIQKAEETLADSINRFEKLGLLSEKFHTFTNDELEQFLLDVSQDHQRLLVSFKDKEEITVKVLAVMDRASLNEKINGTETDIAKAKKQIAQIESEMIALDEEIGILKEVIHNVPKAVDRLNEKVVGELFDTIRTIFSRINSHPLYKEIHFDKGQRYGSNNLLLNVITGDGQMEDASANPSFIFSSAQVNSIALSLFLAMALQQQWSPFRLVALDDPVQSMDDLNVLALIDLIRTLCDHTEFDKQFIISTHDATFYQLMLTKFRFLRVGVIEYEGYDERGPMIRQFQNELGMISSVRLLEPLPKKKFASDFLSVEVSKSVSSEGR